MRQSHGSTVGLCATATLAQKLRTSSRYTRVRYHQSASFAGVVTGILRACQGRRYVVACLALLITTAVQAAPLDELPSGFPSVQLAGRVRGDAALNVLGTNLPALARFYRIGEGELRKHLREDKSLWVDARGRLLYVCDWHIPPATNTAPEFHPLVNSPAGFPYEQTFRLHSRPGATKIIYLDFDGHDGSGTSWGSDAIARPYDIDGDPSTFSNTERDRIQYIWQRVSEDFALYDVDVTTEDPGVEALRKANGADANYGIRVGIGGSSTDWYSSAGGVAYIGSFNWSSDTPCWVFPKSLSDSEKNIAEAVSHEVGHTLGLSHDGQTGTGNGYYYGHGNWAPIMGVGYNEPVVQWSRGEYTLANNQQDDLTVMTTYGVSFRTDDHGNNFAAATALTGPSLNITGNIERNTDLDFFSFQTGAGRVTLTATPNARSPNLHVLFSLYDETGSLVIATNAADTSAGTRPVSVSMIVPTGKYYLSVDGIGEGDPVSTGYSDYGSLGQYVIAGTLPADAGWIAFAPAPYSWTNGVNWASNTVPIGPGVTARFLNNIDGEQVVSLDVPITVGTLLVGDADSSHSFNFVDGDGGPLMFASTTGPTSLRKTGLANDTIAATTVLQTDLFVTNSALGWLIFDGPITGAGGLTKLGAGALILNGTNSFTGATVVAEGTLALGAASAQIGTSVFDVKSNAVLDATALVGGLPLATNQMLAGSGVVLGDVSALAGAILAPGGSAGAGTLTLSNDFVLNGGAMLRFDLAGTETTGDGTNDLLLISGDLVLSGAIRVDFSFLDALPVSPGNYTLIRYTGALVGGATNFTAANASNRLAFAFDDTTPGEIHVLISGSPTNLVWLGDGVQNRWEVQGASNWVGGAGVETFSQLDSVQFDDTGSFSPAVNLVGVLQPANVTINSSNNHTFSGAGKISGPTSLAKSGSGILVLNNANDFSGAMTVGGGLLKLGNSSALGTTNGPTSIGSGAQLDINALSLGAEPLVVSGAGTNGAGVIVNGNATAQTNAVRFVSLNGHATFGGVGRWDVRANPTASFNGGNFNFTKTGANEIWLAELGATALGDIVVNQGLLGLEGSTALGDTTKNLTLNSNTVLALANTDINMLSKKLAMTNAILRSDAGNNIFGGTVALTGSNVVNVAAGLTLQGVVGGSDGFTKLGSGILSLSAANTFTGAVNIVAGTVRARNSGALGRTNGATIITQGGRLDVNGINLGAEPITVTGTGLGNAGAIINFGGTQNNALRFVTLSGNTTFGGVGRWDIRANPTASFAGNGFNLTKTGPNEVWLVDVGPSGLGNITVSEGLLGIQGTSTLGNAASTLTVSSTTLSISATGTNALNKVMTLSAARLANGSGTNIFAGPTTLSGSNNFEVASGAMLTMSNRISGSGSLHTIGAGVLVLATNNTYTGVTRIAAGTLQVGNGLGFGSLGTGNVTNDSALFFNRTNDFTTANFITGTGSLTKQGSGTLTLSGANSYSGATIISAGAIKAGNASALGATNTGTTIASGAVLDVNGFSLGAETVSVTGAGVGGGGAIVNSGATQSNALRYVTLTGNTTFGGPNRWDIRDPGAGGASALNGSFALTKVSSNQIWLANLGATTLGNISINGGWLVVQGTTTLGNAASTLSLSNGATFGVVGTGANVLNKILGMTNATVWSGSGSNTFSGSKVLSGVSRFDVTSGSTLVLAGVVNGAGDLLKTNPGALRLTANNSYSGNTTVSGGTLIAGVAGALASSPVVQVDAGAVLDVSPVGGGFVVGATQTLRGNGTISGNLTVNGTLSPGNSVGRLMFNDSLALAGNLVLETTKAGAVQTNDSLVVNGTLTLGGTLTLVHGGDALAAGDAFSLFTASAYAQSFANRNLPVLTGGLRWDDSLLNTSGILSVATITPPTILPPGYDGTNLLVQITSETGVTYVLEATPSLDAPATWTGVATNAGTGNVLSFPVPVDLGQPQHYFRVNAY